MLAVSAGSRKTFSSLILSLLVYAGPFALMRVVLDMLPMGRVRAAGGYRPDRGCSGVGVGRDALLQTSGKQELSQIFFGRRSVFLPESSVERRIVPEACLHSGITDAQSL